MRLLPLLLLVALFGPCGRRGPSPQPVPTPTPSPASSPAPSPQTMPTPYPTPVVNLAPYLRDHTGPVLTINTADFDNPDVGQLVNAVAAESGPDVKLVIRGGGSIRTPIATHRSLDFHGDYTCDTRTIWEPCVGFGNGVTIGGTGTLYEPTFIDGQPAITVIGTLATNEGRSDRVTVRDITIRGRQTRFDGGVRQAVSFGNCDTCAAVNVTITGTASIGIQFGGSAASGNHALNGVVTGCKLSGLGAAHIAVVNASGMYIFNNHISAPGRTGGPGGVSAIDIETNDPGDWAENLWVYNNEIDYDGAAFGGVGSGILAQQRGSAKAGGLRIVNNRITGTYPLNGLTSGIFFTGEFPGGVVANNAITRAGQSGIQLYGSVGVTFSDNLLTNVGGGGLPAIDIIGGGRNTFRRNVIRTLSEIGGSTSHEIRQQGSVGNVVEER